MDVENARVTGGAERLNAQAASFLTGRTNDVAERLFQAALFSRARVKTSEDEQLQASSSEVSLNLSPRLRRHCWATSYSAVVGSMTDTTAEMRFAGKPPCRACSRT